MAYTSYVCRTSATNALAKHGLVLTKILNFHTREGKNPKNSARSTYTKGLGDLPRIRDLAQATVRKRYLMYEDYGDPMFEVKWDVHMDVLGLNMDVLELRPDPPRRLKAPHRIPLRRRKNGLRRHIKGQDGPRDKNVDFPFVL